MQDRQLTMKQGVYLEGILQGLSGVQACIKAGYKGNANVMAQMAHKLVRNGKVKAVLAKRKAELSTETGYSVEQAQKEYEEARLLAMEVHQPAAASSAITGKARLYGMDKDAGGGEKTVIIISPKPVKAIESHEQVIVKHLPEPQQGPSEAVE